MYAVIVQNKWYGVYETRESAEASAEALNGRVVVLYHPLYTELGDTYGTEM